MGQDEQRLAAGIEAAPVGSSLLAVGADQVGEVVQGSSGEVDRGWVRQQRGSREGHLLGQIACLTGSLGGAPRRRNPYG